MLWISHAKRIIRGRGTAGDCNHNLPSALSDPNGDTPLPGGGVLVTEIGGWVDRFDRTTDVVTPDTHNLPVRRAAAPEQQRAGRRVQHEGRARHPHTERPDRLDLRSASGPGSLAQPSLALALPNDTIAVTDDWHHRVVVIDRKTKRIVWQYGHNGVPGSAPGYLNKPDGLGLLP